MPNGLSSIGYANQGVDDSQLVKQKIASGNQSLATGQIGLENLQRQEGDVNAARDAAATSAQGGATPQMSLLAQSDALAQRGNTTAALQARQAYEQLRNMGVPELVDAVRMNDAPGSRPDLLPVLKRINNYQDSTGATFDGKGNLSVTHSNGSTDVVPIHTLGLLTGQFQPFRQVVQPGASLVTGVVGDTLSGAPQGSVTQAPLAGKFAGTRSGVIYNQGTGDVVFSQGTAKEGYIVKKEKSPDGGEIDHIVDMRPGSPTYGQEVGNNIGGDGGAPPGPNVRKDLPVLNDITQGITQLGQDYGQTDLSNPGAPKVTLTPKGQQTALIAEQIRMANSGLAPRTIIDMAVNGKPMWKTLGGQRTGVVIYKGQEYPMNAPTGAPTQFTPPPVAPPAPVTPGVPVAAPTGPTASGQITSGPVPAYKRGGKVSKAQHYGLG